MLAKTCRDVAQQGENKGRSKELTEQANSPDFSFFPEFFSRIFPKGTSRKQTFLFFYYFLYTFLWTRITKDATTKIGTYNWGGMWSTEIQHVLWKACKNFDNFFFYIFLNFFGNSDETKQGVAEFGSAPNGVKKLLKKFQIFRINERKVMPVLPKVSQSMFSGRHNTAAAVRAKRP